MTEQAGMTPQEFVEKWRRSKLEESAGSQSHFNDLCTMLGHPTPAKADPEGTSFSKIARAKLPLARRLFQLMSHVLGSSAHLNGRYLHLSSCTRVLF